MDTRITNSTFDCGSMPSHWVASIKLLLQAGLANRLRSANHESCGRDLYGKTFLRLSKDHTQASKRGTQHQSQTDSKDHAGARALRKSTRPQHFKISSGACQIPISAKKLGDLWSLTGLEHRYHVYSSRKRVCLPSCCNGLVQSAGALAPAIEQLGNGFLLGSIRRGDYYLRPAGDLQYRSRSAVHLRRICECGARQKYSVQHGRKREGARQHFCRAPLEVGKV